MEETISQEGFSESVDANQQMTLFDMQSLAVKKTGTIEDIQQQLKTAKEMLLDTYEANPLYREKRESVKELSRPFKEVKIEIDRTAEVVHQKNKIRELQNELKEKRAEVSEYALEVYRQTGQREFDVEGQTFEINTVAKLTKRRQ